MATENVGCRECGNEWTVTLGMAEEKVSCPECGYTFPI